MNISVQTIILVLASLSILSCESDKERLSKVEKECVAKTKIEGFNISFFGYFPKDADSLNIQIKRGDHLIQSYRDKISDVISDSLRHQRNYFVKNEILLTDTVFVKIKNEPIKKIYDFKYLVRAHYTMMNKDWGCDFYELKVDGEISDGASVYFTAKEWKILNKNEFKNYYHSPLH
jgi:hypothetical protein